MAKFSSSAMMSLRTLDATVNPVHKTDNLTSRSLVVDGNNDIGIKGGKEDEEVSCSSSSSSCKSSSSASAAAAAPKPQPQLRLTITDSETSTTSCGGDDGSIEVEVLRAAGKSKCAVAHHPPGDSIREQAIVDIESSASSSSDTSAESDASISDQSESLKPSTDSRGRGNIAVADDRHPNENRSEDKIESGLVELGAEDSAADDTGAGNYQPHSSETTKRAKHPEPRGDRVDNDKGASSASLQGDGVNTHPGDNSQEASMTAHLDTCFQQTGLNQTLCMPQKARSCTEDSSLTTASSTSAVVAEEGNMSASLAMLDVSMDSVSRVESASAIRSDTCESGCLSTAPMISFRLLGEDLRGIVASADNVVGVNSDRRATESVDDNDNLSKSVISDGSTSPVRDIEAPPQIGQIMHTRISPTTSEHESSRRLRTSTKSPLPLSPHSCFNAGSGYNKTRLTERLKERLSKQNQASGMDASPTMTVEEGCVSSKPVRDLARDRLLWESRLQAASRQKRPCVPRAKSSGSDKDIQTIYGQSSESGEIRFPDTVTFSDSDHDATNPQQPNGTTKIRSHYRKSFSEVGIPSSFSASRSSRSKLSNNHHSLTHGIGILQPDGIVYDDALLSRLARHARYGRLRGEVLNAVPYDNEGAAGGVRQYNHVRIHVYDLVTKDSLVEMPYFNCNFPLGTCFKVCNDGCHMIGTGAYHVGVEVNGIEYAFGANSIIGMCGIFTCAPKESPGYEYRQTIDFGQLHTTKRTWIRIPKEPTNMAREESNEDGEKSILDDSTATSSSVDALSLSSKKTKECVYSFCEIESFADGQAVIQSMAREYMGSDYDLLRKNCCTFSLDVCIRLGVEKSDIPSWFYNAAQAGADAEDVITNVEKSVWGMLDCHGGMDPLDLECYNHGFEVIMDERKQKNKSDRILTVVESPAMRTPRVRRPLNDFNETASWTY